MTNLKHFKALILLIFLLSVSIFAMAKEGGSAGGGGDAFSCSEVHLADLGKTKFNYSWGYECLSIHEAQAARTDSATP